MHRELLLSLGNPVTVERCVSDVVLVDNALNDSMLNPKLQIQNIQMSSDDQKKVQMERNCVVTTDEDQELQEMTNEEDTQRKVLMMRIRVRKIQLMEI